MKQICMIIFSGAMLISCGGTSESGNDKAEAIPLFEIADNPSRPTYIALRLMDRTDGDTSITYVAQGLYENDTVGFHIELDKKIPAVRLGLFSSGLRHRYSIARPAPP